jgi:CCR4-NOT transcription complex subunit 3
VLSNLLKMSMTHVPPSVESAADRSRSYTPRNPYSGPTPSSFPSMPPSIIENPNLFERLPPDSLFLAFYYQQGSYQQYLAARQLKKHSWRFHKKYMTWFQRHEEPKMATDDFEEGTYVYFDYESGDTSSHALPSG